MPGDVETGVNRTATDPPLPGSTRRSNRFDRPPEPHDWRWIVGGVGRVLISLGLLTFAFVAYQLWGTGIQTAATQNRLRGEFEALLEAAPPPPTTPATTPVTTTIEPTTQTAADSTDPASTVPATTLPVSTVPVSTVPAPPLPERDDPIALLEIPAIGVDEVVVEGTRTADLRNGPGHFPESPLPGQLGNSAIAGHRTTYGAPFYRVDELRSGDPIIVTTLTGRYVYEVTEVFVISADDYGSAVPTNDRTAATLTLISCHPRYTARQRIIVRASLVLAESAPPAAAPTEVKPPDAAPGDDLPDDGSSETAPPEDVAPAVDTTAAGTPTTSDTTSATTRATTSDTAGEGTTATSVAPATVAPAAAAAAAQSNAFNEGWFSDSRAFAQVALWGILLSAVALAAYAVSRRARRNWVGLLTGVIPFVIVLYFFFQNVNRLLPPGL